MTTSANLAAEFYVASQLFRLGYVTTLTLGNTKEIDLIVAHPDGRTVTIDSKGLKTTTNWPVKPKLVRDTHFFALVSYRNHYTDINHPPDVFIIPSTDVHTVLTRWTGRTEVSCVGYAALRNSKYKNAWHLLFGDTYSHETSI